VPGKFRYTTLQFNQPESEPKFVFSCVTEKKSDGDRVGLRRSCACI
jgi:hypothetical protein